MDGPPAQEAVHQLEELISAIEDLRRRVAALEQRPVTAPQPAEPLRPPALPVPLPDVSSGLLAHLGRSLLGIAGAYLLRAITEAGILHELIGTLVGLLYAAGWLLASMRTAASNRVALTLEGLTAGAIAAPLLWEATTRFHAIAPAGAAAALAAFIVLGQVVAWKRGHSAVAAITALAGCLTAIALITATLDPLPFTLALLIAAAAVEYGAVRDHALAWRWITALGVDFCAFLLVFLVTRPHGPPEGYAPIPQSAVVAVQSLLVGVYVAGAAIRTLVRRLRISWFEILQPAVVVAFAAGTNVRPGVAGAMVAAGVACYLAASTAISRLRRNFHAYATYGLILIMTGSFLAVHGVPLVMIFAALAAVAAWLGERRQMTWFRMHAALYLSAAAAVAFPRGDSWLTALAAALVYGIMRTTRSKVETVPQRIPAAWVIALLAAGIYALALAGLARIDASLASTLRTSLISLMAILLGWFGKRLGLAELIWILYPWMAFGAAKLFAEDFRLGRPLTLFASLLVYGGTLIALPRLLRHARARAD